MKLAGINVGSDFKSSFDRFRDFDKNLIIQKNESSVAVSATKQMEPIEKMMPLSSPVLIKSCWKNGRLVEE